MPSTDNINSITTLLLGAVLSSLTRIGDKGMRDILDGGGPRTTWHPCRFALLGWKPVQDCCGILMLTRIKERPFEGA